jgi:hypothetical protein
MSTSQDAGSLLVDGELPRAPAEVRRILEMLVERQPWMPVTAVDASVY